jgi:hypothetical protein
LDLEKLGLVEDGYRGIREGHECPLTGNVLGYS